MKFHTSLIKNLPLLISGPSASGKLSSHNSSSQSTLFQNIMKRYSGQFELCVSCTTRSPRQNERSGYDYYFITQKEFKQQLWQNRFIEHNKVHDNYYGTPFEQLLRIDKKNKIVIMDLDIGGAKQLKRQGIKCNSIFILPPSISQLEKRLRARGSQTQQSLAKRMQNAQIQIENAKKMNLYDHFIINNSQSRFYEESLTILRDMYPCLVQPNSQSKFSKTRNYFVRGGQMMAI